MITARLDGLLPINVGRKQRWNDILISLNLLAVLLFTYGCGFIFLNVFFKAIQGKANGMLLGWPNKHATKQQTGKITHHVIKKYRFSVFKIYVYRITKVCRQKNMINISCHLRGIIQQFWRQEVLQETENMNSVWNHIGAIQL